MVCFLGICPFWLCLVLRCLVGDGELSTSVGRRLFWRACGDVWRTQRCHSDCCYCGVGPDITCWKLWWNFGCEVDEWEGNYEYMIPLSYIFLSKINECNICALSKVFFEGKIFGIVVMWMPSDFSLLVTLWPDFCGVFVHPFCSRGVDIFWRYDF